MTLPYPRLERVQQQGDAEAGNRQHDAAHAHFGGLRPVGLQRTQVSTAFPLTANRVSGRTGVGANQVAGADGSCQVATFGQVFAVKLGGSQAAVPSRGGGRPGLHLSCTTEDGQTPFGVDALDCSPRYPVRSKRICYDDLFVSQFDPGSNQDFVEQESECDRPAQGLHQGEQPIVQANHRGANCQHCQKRPAQHLGKSRLQNNRLHATNLHTLRRED